MSAQLLAFPAQSPATARGAAPGSREPAAAATFPQARPFVPARREYDLGAIAHLVGMAHCSRRVLIETLRKLAEQSGMPLPKTPRIHAGRVCVGPQAIGARSRWDAMVFDAWLDSWTPPPTLAGAVAPGRIVLSDHAGPALRSQMAQRAAALGALGRKRA